MLCCFEVLACLLVVILIFRERPQYFAFSDENFTCIYLLFVVCWSILGKSCFLMLLSKYFAALKKGSANTSPSLELLVKSYRMISYRRLLVLGSLLPVFVIMQKGLKFLCRCNFFFQLYLFPVGRLAANIRKIRGKNYWRPTNQILYAIKSNIQNYFSLFIEITLWRTL